MRKNRVSQLVLRVILLFCWLISGPGLAFLPSTYADPISHIDELIAKHPNWKSVLENPEKGIPDLLRKRRFGTLTEMIREVRDDQFFRHLALSLGTQPPNLITRNLIEAVIQTRHPDALYSLISYTFSQPDAVVMQDLMRKVVKISDFRTQIAFSASVLWRPHSAVLEDLVIDLIETGNRSVMANLATDSFTHPHSVRWEDALKLYIEKADETALRELQRFSLSREHWREPRYAYLKKAVAIENVAERRAYLKKNGRSCLSKALEDYLRSFTDAAND